VCAYICVSFRPKMLDLMGLGWLNDLLLRAVVNPLAKLTMQDQLQGMCDTHCNTLQCTATHCNTLQCTATHCNTLQCTATHCNTLQHTTARCSTMQRTATHCSTMQRTAAHCSTPQPPPAQCRKPSHAADQEDHSQGIHYTHCNTID